MMIKIIIPPNDSALIATREVIWTSTKIQEATIQKFPLFQKVEGI